MSIIPDSLAIAAKDALLAHLGELKENDLSVRVIKPLLEKLGYERVEFVGGPSEKGVDITCWKRDLLGRMELGVVQVKRLRGGISTRKPDSFSDLINQLQQATERPMPSLDGDEYLPTHAYFITPYIISQRALESRFRGLQNLKHRNVKVIDGGQLCELLVTHAVDIVESLLGRRFIRQSEETARLSNNLLLDVLDAPARKNIATFYCDLDFHVGKTNHSVLKTWSLFTPVSKKTVVSIEREHVERLKLLDAAAKRSLGVQFVLTTEEEFESQRKSEWAKWAANARSQVLNATESRDTLQPDGRSRVSRFKRIEGLLHQILEYEKRARTASDKNRFEHSIEAQRWIARLTQFVGRLEKEKSFTDDGLAYLVREETELRAEFSTLSEDKAQPYANFTQLLFEEVVAGFLEMTHLAQHWHPVDYSVCVDAEALRHAVSIRISRIRDEIACLNTNIFPEDDLRRFVGSCTETFSIVESVESLTGIAHLFRQRGSQTVEVDDLCLRIPINRLFDTRANVAVFGEAGAGKTTTLQMYAKQRRAMMRDGLVVFVPLSAIVAGAGSEPAERGLLMKDDDEPLIAFEKAISEYLLKHHEFPLAKVAHFFAGKPKLFLLDGIDEAIKRARWILDGIKAFSRKYSDIQIIVSSRHSGDYLEKIDFFSVTMRPFTPAQRDFFVERWFVGSARSAEKVEQIRSHLTKRAEIGNVITNPLLATICCVLAENDVPLPDREIRLYEERKNLLLGAYDLQRGIKRITTRRYQLDQIAESLAFQMHKASKRAESPQYFIRTALDMYQEKFGRETVTKAVNELFDPCNILVPMDAEGNWGFGHLRFQEYFAACELEIRHEMNFREYASNPWWKGVFVLLAQKVRALDSIVERLLADRNLREIQDVLHAMIAVRSPREQKHLNKLIEEARRGWREPSGKKTRMSYEEVQQMTEDND